MALSACTNSVYASKNYPPALCRTELTPEKESLLFTVSTFEITGVFAWVFMQKPEYNKGFRFTQEFIGEHPDFREEGLIS